ncbi:hypothetical protein EU800_06925 [Tropicimonas sp. IMCC6043]|nr:hypothetical protein EU800_06925 [Tropicimonas sp. IMCC6043]
MPRPACAEAAISHRPRIAIMGEFSAGKSTLTNLLIGSDALPVKVTATHLPPVWLSHGNATPRGVGLDDVEFDIDLANLSTIPLERTQFLRVERPAGVLELCDIIDFPGISDPNMPAEIWQRLIARADAVIWCSHAVQAWRQSEAAVWDVMPPELRERSFLLLTRMDKLTSERDRRRVLARVRHETDGLFAQVFPVSLTEALAAGDDASAWEQSGARAFMDALLDLVMTLSKLLGREIPAVSAINPADDDQWDEEDEFMPIRPATIEPLHGSRLKQAAPTEAARPGRIVPRRVHAKGTARRPPRPQAPEDELADIFRQG